MQETNYAAKRYFSNLIFYQLVKSVRHNYFNRLTKLFLDPYLKSIAKFLELNSNILFIIHLANMDVL